MGGLFLFGDRMDLLLQVWGGGFYLANKILFALAEGQQGDRQRRMRILGWLIYLLGVPAWVVILVGKHDWIAASIEAGGIPAMLLGLVTVLRHRASPQRLLDLVASTFTYAALLLGVGYSLYDYGGVSALSQVLEIGVMIGFLLGSYLLAKQNATGWLFFMLMNCSMATLMLLQHKPLLAVQQGVSLGFVLYGYALVRKNALSDRHGAAG